MRIFRVDIENFRGVASGSVSFSGHALLVGPNNVGKSTVLEALDLALGPNRLVGACTIDEHDFRMGQYLPQRLPLEVGHQDVAVPHNQSASPEETSAPKIIVTVTLGDLTEGELTKFRSHVELWDPKKECVPAIDEAVTSTPALADYVLRIRFTGWYDTEDDEFKAETVFLNPVGDPRSVTKQQKQLIGFLYLRSLRTGSRAATLQRGSLMDVLMNVAKAKPRFWQELLSGLGELGQKASQDSGVRTILDDLEKTLAAYLPRPLPGSCSPSRINVTQLTRENLRSTISFFLASFESGHLLPFDHQGSGMTNILVLALLTLIARRKSNVIFAMEEPEIALGPTVQRRIIANLKSLGGQSILTSHSPYVAEQMLPDQIIVLRRGSDGILESQATTATPRLKEKILRADFRSRYAEGLLGTGVVIVEGVTEVYALPVASDILANVPETAYRSLDILGVVPVAAGSDGDLAKVASFFSGAGINTYVFCDTLNDAAMLSEIQEVASDVHQHPYRNFESVLSDELSINVIQRITEIMKSRGDYPVDVIVPEESATEPTWRAAFREVLSKRKGSGYSAIALQCCQANELPVSIRRYLGTLHNLATGAPLPSADPISQLLL